MLPTLLWFDFFSNKYVFPKWTLFFKFISIVIFFQQSIVHRPTIAQYYRPAQGNFLVGQSKPDPSRPCSISNLWIFKFYLSSPLCKSQEPFLNPNHKKIVYSFWWTSHFLMSNSFYIMNFRIFLNFYICYNVILNIFL